MPALIFRPHPEENTASPGLVLRHCSGTVATLSKEGQSLNRRLSLINGLRRFLKDFND
jgi:hypothetical protein